MSVREGRNLAGGQLAGLGAGHHMRAGCTRLSTRSNTRPAAAAAAGSTPGTADARGQGWAREGCTAKSCTAGRRPCRQQTSRRGRAQSRRCGSLPTGDAAMRRCSGGARQGDGDENCKEQQQDRYAPEKARSSGGQPGKHRANPTPQRKGKRRGENAVRER